MGSIDGFGPFSGGNGFRLERERRVSSATLPIRVNAERLAIHHPEQFSSRPYSDVGPWRDAEEYY